MDIPNCTSTLVEILKDIGCEQDTIDKIMEMEEVGNSNGIIRLLASHRQRLLEDIHSAEKKMRCLDYLVYHIKKKV